MQHTNVSKNSFIIPPDLLDDIGSRFLLDAPDKELNDPMALCFLTELAYWFYLDNYVEDDDTLNALKFDPFALQLFVHMGIKPKKGTLEDLLYSFREFKIRVPTYGALMLNEDLSQVLLVQGFFRRASWGFPKGKINVDEECHDCAIREVLEETGYDITSQINKSDYLETTIGEQKTRLYIIPRVSMDTEFVPKTKGEIKELKWFPINQLPFHKKDKNFGHSARSTNMFYNVIPFVKLMRWWIANVTRSGSMSNDHTGGINKESRRKHKSLTCTGDSQIYQKNYAQASPSTMVDSTRNSPGSFYSNHGQCENGQQNNDQFRNGGEVSPKKKDNKLKHKNKKHNPSETLHDDHQKFAFKSRSGKPKNTNRQNNDDTSPKNASKQFRSYSWQTFKINKKAINEALDKVWSGVSL